MPKNSVDSHLEHSNDFRILIVEDQSTDIIGTYMLTHHLGFDVTLTFDGGQALNQIINNPFDLVILDWNLPLVSGEDFLNYIENERLALTAKLPIKIILHSGSPPARDEFRDSKRFEIVDVWKKPLSVSEISRKLKRFNLK